MAQSWPMRRALPRELGSMRGDVRLFDNVAPDVSFLSNKIGGLGRAVAGSLQVELGEVGLRLRALENLVDCLVELGDDCGGRFWWRDDRIPRAGVVFLSGYGAH